MRLSGLHETGLWRRLEALRPQLAAAAQAAYDDWDEETFGGGGICDQVAQALTDVLATAGVEVTDGGQEGDDHAFAIAYDLYERGSGYAWERVPDVVFRPQDVTIEPTWRPDWIAGSVE